MVLTIVRHGVPLGEVELGRTESINHVDFRPLPGYAAVSAVVTEARRAMRGEFFVTGGAAMAAEDAAFERAMAAWRALNSDLELRDGEGHVVPTTAIELLEEEERSPFWRWTATIVFLEAPAGEGAEVPRMRCVDCDQREATIVWVQGSGAYTNIDRADGTRLPDRPARGRADLPPRPRVIEGRRGPNLCGPCARRRYEAALPEGAPDWETFTRQLPRDE